MHFCAKTWATFARSSMFWWIRCDMTGIIVERSRFEWVFATATATSLPMTVTPTCMTASGITGLTFPGMIEEPGWTAGRFSSRRPVWGPDPSHRRSFAIFIIEIATVRIAPGRQQALVDFEQGGDVDRRRDDVVRGLAHVHVVIRMDGAFLPERMAQDLVRTVRDHLVRVHVRRGPAAGLEDVEREVRVQLPVHHLLTRLDDRFADLVIEQSEFHVRLGARHLDEAEGVDEPPAEANSADREVFDRSLRLDSPIRVFWDFDLPQEVSLDAELRHSNAPRCRQSPGGINIVNRFVRTNGPGRPETTRDPPGGGPAAGPFWRVRSESGSVDGGASPDIRTSVVLRRAHYSLNWRASRSCYCER